ncbi:hypothetical protein ANCCAN_04377 [Ancylostoma caninum]|uniref:Uncharacterized protein n=1 Tax=Ancylostoma caninum TaxID=29170 RepID=A0A368H2U0_ANCCA|nr:hypothetical protein ANCCAN_04377 [Ancylostoma caninum]
MMRVQKEIKKRVAAIPNMTVSNIVENGDDFIQRIQRHLVELHTRINEVDHPPEIAEFEATNSFVYSSCKPMHLAANKTRLDAGGCTDNIDENARIDDESSHATKEEQCSHTEPVTIPSAKKRGRVVTTSESPASKAPREQVRRAAGSDEGSMAESNIQIKSKDSNKRTRKPKKKKLLTDGEISQSNRHAVDTDDKRFSEEVLKMDAESFEDGSGLPAKPKLDADFENNLRSLENLVKGPDRRRLAALGIFE